MSSRLTFLALLPFALAFPSVRQDLTLRLDPYQEACFYDVALTGQKVFFHYQVSSGGSLDVDVLISAPSGFEVYTEYRRSDGKVLFAAPEAGEYSFCFQNKLSSVAVKTVMFTIVVGDPMVEAHRRELPGPLHLLKNITYVDPLDATLLRISETMAEIRNEQEYMRTRERIHRDTAESTNTRVLVSFVVQCVFMFALTAAQLYILRRSVERKLRV